MIGTPPIRYEVSQRTRAIAAGGIGVVQQLVRQLGVADSIDRGCPIFKFWMPYSEADHMLNNGQLQNIGVLLGKPSGWLIDVDLDHPRAVELAEEFLPATAAIFGRTSKPRSH